MKSRSGGLPRGSWQKLESSHAPLIASLSLAMGSALLVSWWRLVTMEGLRGSQAAADDVWATIQVEALLHGAILFLVPVAGALLAWRLASRQSARDDPAAAGVQGELVGHRRSARLLDASERMLECARLEELAAVAVAEARDLVGADSGRWLRGERREDLPTSGARRILTPVLADLAVARGYILLQRESSEFTEEDEALVGRLAHLASLAAMHLDALYEAESGRRVLAALLERVPLGLLVADSAGHVRWRSDHGLEIGQALSGDLATWRLLHSEGGEPRSQQLPISRALGGEDGESEWLVQGPEGEERYVRSTFSPVVLGSAGDRGAIITFRDVTRDRRSQEALRREKEEAEASNQAKSQFLARMSHEIRTPLNAVMGMAHLLQHTELDARQIEYVGAIQVSSEHLLTLISDVLDLAKVEAGVVEVEEAVFDLWDTVENVIEMLGQKAQRKRLELVLAIRRDVPSRLLGDPGKIRQVLLNLAGNAIKYTEEGTVLVRVTLLERRASGARIRFDVTDTGAGIEEERLGDLFKQFSKGVGLARRRIEGNGLGLAISKTLVEQMGGQIGASSAPGRGSEFWFTVECPLAPAPLAALSPGPVRELRCLVVDPDPTTCQVLADYLADHGHAVTRCHDLEGGLGLMEGGPGADRPVDMLLVAAGEEGPRGGWLPLQDAARESGTVLVPVVARSAAIESRELTSLGFRHLLCKPLTPGRVRDLLSAVGVEVSGRMEERRPTGVSCEQMDPRRDLLLLLVEDNDTNRHVALAMLEKLGYIADAVGDGQKALEALSFMDYDLVLMDVRMPIMDGIVATRAIRAGQWGVLNPQVPILAITANATPEEQERCLAAGMNGFLPKPVRPQVLDALLSSLLLDREADETPQGEEKPPAGPPPVFEARQFLERMGGDAEIMGEVLRAFLGDAPKLLRRAWQALQDDHAESLVRAAHSLKGAAAQVGAVALSQAAAALEEGVLAGDAARPAELLGEVEEAFVSFRAEVSKPPKDGTGEVSPMAGAGSRV